MGPPAPFVAHILDRRLDRTSRAPVAVAFSGGGDSLALLLLAKAWANGCGREVLALTVDHGLHPSSAAWTAWAGEAAKRAGVHWRGLAWTGEKPERGIPAAARAARYRLISQAAREAGAKVVLVGHTADDVRESELMRERDARALGRLREWSPVPVWPQGRELFLLRPLLQTGRQELRDWLRAQGLSWFEDPSNADPRYARTRARRALAGADRASPSDGAPFRRKPEEGLAQLGRYATVTSDGRVVIARAFLRNAPGAAESFVSLACLCASGQETPPRAAAIERLTERIAAEAPFTATLAGARIVAGEVAVTFAREAGERARGGLEPLTLTPGHVQVWDGRFEASTDIEGLALSALAGHTRRLGQGDRQWLKGVAPYARGPLPAVLDPAGRAALPAPFGRAPVEARALAKARLTAACGLVQSEAEL